MDRAVLIISYFFAPFNSSGVFRVLRLSKFLPVFGWRPHILTIKESNGMISVDNQLCSYIDTSVTVHRTLTIDLQHFYFRHFRNIALQSGSAKSEVSKWIKFINSIKTLLVTYKSAVRRFALFPDANIMWLPFAVYKGYFVIKQFDIEAIVATGGPWTDFLVGFLLSKITGKDLILDFRDLWSKDKVVPYPTSFHTRIAAKLERILIKHAKKVVSVTDLMTTGFKRCYPEFSDKFITITNGFDSSFTTQRSNANWNGSSYALDKFRLVYAGTFYANRRPDTFMRALYELVHEHPHIRSQIEFRFAGADFQNVCNELVEKYSLSDIVTRVGFLSYAETHTELREADVAVLIVPPQYKEEITGKVFEYFMAGRKILAVVPEDGSAAGLVRETRTGVVASVEDVGEIKRAILHCYDEWKNKQQVYSPDEEELSKYDMRTKAAQLSDILNKVAS